MIEQLKTTIKDLEEAEAKSLLLQLFLRIQSIEEASDSEKQLINEIKQVHDDLLQIPKREGALRHVKAVHVVFGDSAAGSLKMALKEMGKSETEAIVPFPSLFSVGPITALDESSGIHRRNEWMENHFSLEEEEIESEKRRFNEVVETIQSLPAHIPMYIWAGGNSHEQTGLRFVMQLVQGKGNDFYSIRSDKRYKGIEDYPLHTGELTPEKLLEIYRIQDGDRMTQEERNKLEAEWAALAQTENVLRVWEDERIKNVEKSYFDQQIISTCRRLHSEQGNKDFIKALRLIGELIGHVPQYIGDMFYEYRVRQLALNGVFEIYGVPKGMRYYSVKMREL